MNERLNQLMIQCEKKYCQDHDDYFYDMEKFSELMVKDFLFQLADARLEFVWTTEIDEVFKQTVDKIKQHYGVEK